MDYKPVLGILLGDAAGIGPELVAKLAASSFYSQYCRPLIIGDMRVFQAGLSTAGVKASCHTVTSAAQASWDDSLPVLDTCDQDPVRITTGRLSAYCGAGVLNSIEIACRLCQDGYISGFVHAPFHKAAMRAAGCKYASEQELIASLLETGLPHGEVNLLGDVMTVRVTSHIPLKDVSSHLTTQGVYQAIELCHSTANSLGIEFLRIGVAALNPHCGESGLCGREEIDIIIPAITAAREQGYDALGPFSSDTVFIKAFNGELDAVVTMYHDQGQIALKLKGFDLGVTLAGGLPYPIATCAQGTAFDIAGMGRAGTTAFENAVRLAARIACTTARQGRC